MSSFRSKLLKYAKNFRRKAPTSAEGWRLFDDDAKSEKAAEALGKALEAAGDLAAKKPLKLKGKDRESKENLKAMAALAAEILRQKVYPVMDKYDSLGASDTEPRMVAKDHLARILADRFRVDFEDILEQM